jgi:hypothetical protein
LPPTSALDHRRALLLVVAVIGLALTQRRDKVGFMKWADMKDAQKNEVFCEIGTAK